MMRSPSFSPSKTSTVYGDAAELHVDSHRVCAVVTDLEDGNSGVLGAVYGASDLENAVDLFDVDGAVHFEACPSSFGHGIEGDIHGTRVA